MGGKERSDANARQDRQVRPHSLLIHKISYHSMYEEVNGGQSPQGSRTMNCEILEWVYIAAIYAFIINNLVSQTFTHRQRHNAQLHHNT
jgi:hypothetical protein